jgi:two-component system KDP operon response regulator KdpE
MEQRQPHILIIEDDDYSREALEYFLTAEGYRTQAVANGCTGYRVARRTAPDLIVLDLGLPDLDGKQLIERLRRHRKLRATPIIVVSGLSGEAAAALGANVCLLKPVAFEELLQAIQDLRPVNHSRKSEVRSLGVGLLTSDFRIPHSAFRIPAASLWPSRLFSLFCWSRWRFSLRRRCRLIWWRC